MSSPRPLKRLAVGLFLSGYLGSLGCNRDTKPEVADSLKTAAPAANVTHTGLRNTGWDESAAGSFMVLSVADDPINAALVLPQETDSTLSKMGAFNLDDFANIAVDLIGPGGAVGKSSIAINAQQLPAEGCLVWPSVRLTVKPLQAWKVGFAADHAAAIKMDSVEQLGAADSSSVTTELAKQASAISSNDDPAFQGLPFIVQKAYRLSLGDTADIVASIVRKINEEANPREERLLLIIERTSNGGDYSVAFQTRSAGSEDVVRTNTMLAAVRFVRTNRVALVVSFEYDDGGQVALLERVAPRSWKITWRSAYTGC
jgi:hypothetical protein